MRTEGQSDAEIQSRRSQGCTVLVPSAVRCPWECLTRRETRSTCAFKRTLWMLGEERVLEAQERKERDALVGSSEMVG